jgi:hypothetical protein
LLWCFTYNAFSAFWALTARTETIDRVVDTSTNKDDVVAVRKRECTLFFDLVDLRIQVSALLLEFLVLVNEVVDLALPPSHNLATLPLSTGAMKRRRAGASSYLDLLYSLLQGAYDVVAVPALLLLLESLKGPSGAS